MRILCLDVGEKRIGVAISDPLGISAQGLGVLQRKGIKQVLQEIRRLVEDYQAEEIVLGLPLNMDGTRGEKAGEILRLQDFLSKKIQIPIKTWDERLTTVEAQKVLLSGDVTRAGRKKVIDKLAAVLILDNYLRYKAHQRNDSQNER